MKILVVDDDFASRRILGKIAFLYGEYEVATDGQEGVETFKTSFDSREPFDLIFLDIMMPKMDGLQVLQKIRQYEEENGILLGEGVKIIMITALNDSSNIINSFKEGCEKYLVKPIRKQEVIDIMDDIGFPLKK